MKNVHQNLTVYPFMIITSNLYASILGNLNSKNILVGWMKWIKLSCYFKVSFGKEQFIGRNQTDPLIRLAFTLARFTLVHYILNNFSLPNSLRKTDQYERGFSYTFLK